MSRKYRVWICFEAHRPDGEVWAVKWRNEWLTAPSVHCGVPLTTVYRGAESPQPRAYLQGVAGRVTKHAGIIRILDTTC